MGEYPFFQTGNKDNREFQPFGIMKGHQQNLTLVTIVFISF
jgi:hypothetical protein